MQANDSDFTRQDSCFSNCRRMLCDRSKIPNQLDIYEAYKAPVAASNDMKRQATPRWVKKNINQAFDSSRVLDKSI